MSQCESSCEFGINMLLTDVLAVVQQLADLVTNLTVWELNIFLGVANIVHEGQEVIISDIELNYLLAHAQGRSQG